MPCIEADIVSIGAVDRGLDDDGWRAVPRAGRAPIDETAHVFGKTGHIERSVLHADINVVGPGVGVLLSLVVGQGMAAMAADVINRLVLLQQF